MKKPPSVHVALSEAEKKLLQNAAAIDGLKLSPWLRMLGLREAAAKQLKLPPASTKE